MKKFIAVLLFVCIFVGTASANLIYNTSNGMLGLIEISSNSECSDPVIQYTKAGSDSLVASYANGENSNILLIQRTSDILNLLGDTALIFSPNNLSQPANEYILTGVYDTFKVGYAYNGKNVSVFVASDMMNSLTELNADTFNYVRDYSSDITTAIKDFVVNSFIYMLVDTTSSKDVLYRFDGQLIENGSDFITFAAPEHTNCIDSLSNGNILAGHSGGVSILSASGQTFSVKTETDGEVKAVCADSNSDSDGFYFITQTESDGIYTSSLRHFNGSTDTLLKTITSQESNSQIILSIQDSIMSAIMGGKIFVYSSQNDSLLGEFDSDSLCGNPVSITTSYVVTDDYGSSGGNGCNLTGAGIILLALAGFMTMKIKE